MIKKIYSCDLCGNQKEKEDLIELVERGKQQGWRPQKLGENFETGIHLCFPCISSIQSVRSVCVAGFTCKGGITCTSDHK